MPEIIWTSYLRYRTTQRGFDLDLIEDILRFSSERYYDMETDRAIAVEKHRHDTQQFQHYQAKNVNIGYRSDAS